MKILYITMLAPYPKAEPFITNEMLELQRQGHHVFVAPILIPNQHIYKLSPAFSQCTIIKKLWDCEVLLTSAKLWLTSRIARSAVKQVLMADLTPKVFLRNLAVIPKALWISKNINEWKPDHIHAHWIHMSATTAMLVHDITGIPFSITAHRGDIIDNNLLDIKANKSVFVRFISDYSKQAFADRVPDAARFRSIRINMGVMFPNEIHYVPSVNSSDIKIMCPAHFIPRKSQSTLIQAASVVQKSGFKVHIIFAGDGPDLPACQKLCQDLNVKADFLGIVPNSSILDMYREGSVDMMVLPSLAEGIPVSLMEAMAYGVPVIATAVDGVPELLSDNCGLMIQPKQPDELAKAIISIATNMELAATLSQNGRKRIEQHFNQPEIVKQLVEQMQPHTA